VAEVEFAGAQFTVAEKIGLMPLMRFAKVAKAGADANDMDSLAALYDLLEQCIAPSDWHRFEATADESRADGDALMGLVRQVFAVLAERPTSLPSDSSGGQTSTPQNSADASYLRVVKRLEAEGRPDTALIVQMANESRSLASAS
jgi:hypothetical protein